MNNVLITIGLLIVAVLGALFAVPQYVDWNTYRGVIEEEASRLAGRDVRIAGNITLRLLPSPSFVINKLRVADQANVAGDPMFRAEQMAARLSVVPLLRGVLEANEIELVQPVLRFVLDDSGQGNWRSLGKGAGTLPFALNDVALQSVQITNGTVLVLDRSGARERLALPLLSGQLSAPALEGPYRFRGNYGPLQQSRDVRFTTTPPDASGIVQLKAALKDIATGATASFDGRLLNLTAQPSVAGELTAAWPLPSAETGPKPSPQPSATPAAGVPQGELKSELTGDLSRLTLRNLSVAFESAGRPEVMSGEASFAWGDDVAMTLRLAAPWLDLDPVLGTRKGSSPTVALASLAQRINGLVGSVGSIDTTLEIDQANLGHELVGAIRMSAKSEAGALVLNELRVALPGGTRLEAQGRITGQDAATSFDGDMTLQGTSLARLGAWVAGGQAIVAPEHDRAFLMRGRIASELERISLTSIEADVGDGLLRGRLDYTWSAEPRLAVVVEGARVDGRAVLRDKTTLQRLADSITTRTAGGEARLDVSVRVRATELILPERRLYDVNASLLRNAAGLSIDELQFSASHGVSVSIEGRRTTDGALELRGAIGAADLDGLTALAEIFDIPLERIPATIAPDLLPLQLAGTFSKAAGTTGAVRIVADGRLAAADAKVRVGFDAGLDSWRSARLDADLALLAPSDAGMPEKVFAALRGGVRLEQTPQARATTSKAAITPERLTIRATGIAAQGLLTAARFDSAEMALVFDGPARVSETNTPDITGGLTFDARDGRDILQALVGLDATRLPPLAGVGTARLSLRGEALALDEIKFTGSATGLTVAGRLSADRARQGQIRGALRLSSLEASALLPTVQAQQPLVEAAEQLVDARNGVWPQRTFDFGPSGVAAPGADVEVTIEADQFRLPSGAAVSGAKFTYAMRRDAHEVRDFQGQALGGNVSGAALLSRSARGATLTTRFSLAGGRLESFGPTGGMDAVFDVQGAGTSPAALVSALSGTGNIMLTSVQVRDITPATLQSAIDTALAAPPDKVGPTLRAALGADGARGTAALGARKVTLTVQDGVARSDVISFPSPAGKTAAQGALDLATFSLTGLWRVETALAPFAAPAPSATSAPSAASAEPAASVPLPAVVQRFQIRPQSPASGSAQKPARTPVEVDALERELAVRKVERDLAELERLRRLDEERATFAREKDAAAEAAARSAEPKPVRTSP